MKDTFSTKVEGHVLIKDDQGKILLDKKNAIHPKHMAIALARGLSNSPNFQIFKIKLGNHGTKIIDGKIVFNPPKVQPDDNDLYNATYAEIVDESDADCPPGNSVTYSEIPGTTNTRVIVTAVISPNEAIGRATDEADTADPTTVPGADGEIDPESEFFFDELGLFTKQTSGTILNGAGDLMLSMITFSPIEHTGSRELTVLYSISVSVA